MILNGLDEHFNQTIVNVIFKYAQEQKETWNDLLGVTVYSYNTAVHKIYSLRSNVR